MSALYPLRFAPIFRRYLWGGDRLATKLSKQCAGGGVCAESWEVADHGSDQSVVAAGPLERTTLHRICTEFGVDLFGRHPQASFPLLFKFLDANSNLSVQVHPDDEAAAKLDPPDLGKTEAWYVLDAAPRSKIYAGWKEGIDRRELSEGVRKGDIERLLHVIYPKQGDCVFIPAGVVHAIGAGVLVAEIQQSSDSTFRIFDWNRVGDDGKPRTLHIDQALQVLNFDSGPVKVQTPEATGSPLCKRLVQCDKFVLDRWSLSQVQTVGGDHRFHILAVTCGSASVTGDAANQPLRTGDTILLPASVGAVQVAPQPNAVLLDMYLG